MGIDHGGPHVAMAKQFLNGMYIVIILQQMAGITVAEGMGGSPFADFSLIHCSPDRFLYMGFVQMITAHLPRTLFSDAYFLQKSR